ncbi:GntR family transcriptional regulator [Thermomicrobium roseum]|jgi:DNA-binding GntR family transcriptional regulator|uniref:Transcriptional regulater GntR family protein n=1 Tax=Thermomicrobium roseum (strain ATCC 27502 / DSM 5159 / P-2) TaxID=309801 RepID=B9L552_THERP|nr:GntR family transcriptional regulator [Thermomicrobium roseum]ACM06855.1 transcriptional regulater GntR family protein [Thermomicrobium roseum DSM 5159]
MVRTEWARKDSCPELLAGNGHEERETVAAQRAYDLLVDRLIRGVYRPGDWLNVRAVCAELGISRTPVMEAIKRLEQEGFLEVIPRAGCRVAQPGVDEMQQIFRMRIALEGIAAAEVAANPSPERLALLEELVREGNRAVEDQNPARFAAVNLAFHQAVAAASGSRRLFSVLQHCWLASRYYLASIPYFDKNMQRSAEEHAFIVQAIRFGWTEVAREAIAAHLQRCIFAFQQYLPHSQEQPAPAVPSPLGHETIPWLGRVHRLG